MSLATHTLGWFQWSDVKNLNLAPPGRDPWYASDEVDADVNAGGVEKPGLLLDVLHGKLLYLD